MADRARPFVQFARQVSRALLKPPHDDLSMFRKSYLVPRMARSLFDPAAALDGYWLSQLLVYLSELNSIAAGGGPSRFRDCAPMVVGG